MTAPSLSELTRAAFKIGCLGFGGPAGQIALMHRIFVEEKQWIDEARFLHALNFCTLLPGPEAQQLATYVGWLLHGVRGGVIAGLLFVAPGALVVLALSWAYAAALDAPLMAAASFGIKAVVLALVLEALISISRRALTSPMSWAIALGSFAALFFAQAPFPLVIAAAAIIGYIALDRGAPRLAPAPAPAQRGALGAALFWSVIWLAPPALMLVLLGRGHVLTEIGALFSTLAVVTFGGAYATLAYLQQQAVDAQGWLTAAQMIDGLGLAETTPGPLVLVNQFVGFIAGWREGGAGLALAGAALASWCTFAPSFVWIFAGAPYAERLRTNARARSALAAISAAVLGIITSLALWFAAHVLFARVVRAPLGAGLSVLAPDWARFDVMAGVLTLCAVTALLRFKIGVVWLVMAAAAAGVALSAAGLA